MNDPNGGMALGVLAGSSGIPVASGLTGEVGEPSRSNGAPSASLS